MPPTIILKQGATKISDRTANIHPDAWDGTSHKWSPLNSWPMTTVLDKVGTGMTSSRVFHWFEKPFNSLTGTISDVYTTSSLGTGVSTATASGSEVFIKPDTAGFSKMGNLRTGMTVEIYSTSVFSRITGVVGAVHIATDGTSYFSLVLDATDSSEVLVGTGLSWTIIGDSAAELHELPESVSEHETEYYNYVQTMIQSFKVSEDEINEASRLNEDPKMEREMEAFRQLQWRREYNLLEGVRRKTGDTYSAGGLRWFLSQNEGGNIIDWRTDTTYSATTDTVLGGTLPMLKRVSKLIREFSTPGTRKMLVTSQDVLSVIDECVLASGMYNIGWETNRYGLHVKVLRGLDHEIELVEEPLFNSNTAKKNVAYIIEPSRIKRKTVTDGALKKIPWSQKGTSQPGDQYKSWVEGGWRVKETYQFTCLQAHCIIDNIGLEKP